MFVTSSLLSEVPGLIHGFGTIAEPLPSIFSDAQFWNLHKPKWKQVHGTKAIEVKNQTQECGDADALWTKSRNVPLGVRTADCVPIILAKKSGDGLATIHSGWRGTLSHVVQNAWKSIEATGERPEKWFAAIGPSIGPCCYQVSEEIISDFFKKFPWISPKRIEPRSRMLDLQAIVLAQLESIGFEQIDLIQVCTKCSKSGEEFVFHSYRRDANDGRQMSLGMLT